MMGYRDTSNYDPYGTMNQGRPLRPFNLVQWSGVGLALFGIALYAAYFAGRLGWTSELLDSPMFGFAMLMLGVVLVNSRRESSHDLAPELAAQRKRWLLIIIAIAAAVLGAAALIELQGA